jgi:transposase
MYTGFEVKKMEPVYNFQGMFAQSLGLKDPWSITKAVFEPQERAVHIYISGRKTAKYACPECGELCSRYDEEEDERVWRHADVVLYPCFVHSRRPRVNCSKHGIHVVDAPWARSPYSRFTLGFEGFAMLLAQTMSMNEARRILRISRTAMLNIATYWIEKAVREDDLSHISRLSIDETSFKRGHSYVTIIGAPEEKRVIGVEEGRDIGAVERFSQSFEERKGDCNKIRYVSMDMSLTYKSATRLCFPEATIVYDHFHVKKLMLDAMDTVRREEQGRKIAKQKSSGRKLLMIPEHKMNQQQRDKLTKLSREYPKVGRAFRMVMQLDDLYRCQTRPEAESVLRRLTSWMMHSKLEPMKRAAASLRRHKDEIMTYFEQRISNAFAEGMNSLIQTAKRKARGFHTFQGFRTAIYLAVGKLALSFPQPW